MLSGLRRAVRSRLGADQPRLGADDRGVTLAELMVSMILTTILGTMAVLFFVGSSSAGYKSVLTNQNSGDARLTLDSWTSMLRVAGWLDPSIKADRFEEVTSTKIVFYANLGNRATNVSGSFTAPAATTKIALMLRVSNTSTGVGQLIEVVFEPDNTTVRSVRQLGFNAKATAGLPVFQPYSRIGSALDLTQLGCLNGTTPTPGLCLQSGQPGSGMPDPSIGAGSLAVSSGNLRGNPAHNVDTALNQIGSVAIAFTALDPSNTSSMAFTSLASVSSGFPS
ncbi:MAG TPA: prepilin-type N-terminal cleavage/methylation domain-containing protein [Jatrophihabitans sp.]|uniref:PilW family protein n=1 Tax=Jatrophihabitans sp. TaxID=1932789 RepID=UPI002EFF8AF8